MAKKKQEQGTAPKGDKKKKDAPEEKGLPPVPARMRVKYQQEIVPKLREKFSYANVNAVPRLRRIVLNIGLGEGATNIKLLDAAADELAQIAGQKAVITRAKKSIAAFKLRAGMPIGCAVTLRGERMYEFLDRLVSIALPRVRDFRGLPTKSFDGRGNYTVGIREHIIFPEVDFAKVERIKGMNITFVTSATTDEEARELLALLGVPFSKTAVAAA